MLGSMRKTAQGSFFKYIIFGLLIIAFGSWGLTDFTVPQDNQEELVATIEDTEIGYDFFSRQFSRQFPVSPPRPESPTDFDPARLLIIEMVKEQLRNHEVDDLNISISQQQLRSVIARNPTFHNQSGQFDAQLFHAQVGRSGLTEDAFLQALTAQIAQDSLNNAVGGSLLPPKNVTEIIHQFQHTQRHFEVAVISDDSVDVVPTDNETVLKKFYDDNKDSFVIPEKRDVQFIWLQKDSIIKDIKLNDDELKQYYDNNQDAFKTARILDFNQVIFTDKDKADMLYNSYQNQQGKDLQAVNDSLADKGNFIPLTDIALHMIPDEKLRAHITNVNVGDVATPFEGPFGWVVIQLQKDTPEKITPFDDVKEDIIDIMADNKANDDINRLRNMLDDELVSGATLESAAEKLNLPFFIAKNIEETGISDTEQFIPDDFAFLGFAFQADANIPDPIVVDTQEKDGFFALIVTNVVDSHIATFEEGYNIIRDRHYQKMKTEATREKAGLLLEDAHNTGKGVLKAALEKNISAQSLGPISVVELAQQFPIDRKDINRLFTSNINDKLMVEDQLGGYHVIQVTKIEPPETQENSTELKQQITDAYANMMHSAQINAFDISLENKFDTQIWLDRVNNVYQ